MDTITKPIIAPDVHGEFVHWGHKGGLADQLKIGKRVRPLNMKKVDDLAASIKREGMLQPILVSSDGGGVYSLLAGDHRLAAIRKVWSEVQDPSEYPLPVRLVYCAVQHREMIEISENLNRNDLSKSERSVLGARYGKLVEKERSSTNGGGSTSGGGSKKGKKGPDAIWFTEWYVAAHIPQQTARRHWSESARPPSAR